RIAVTMALLTIAATGSFARQDSKAVNASPFDVTVTASASPEKVRFTAPSSVVQMHLEVYWADGQKLFDLEMKRGNVLDWHLEDGQAEHIKSGSYLCVVTVKNLSGKLAQRIGTISISDQKVTIEPVQASKLNAQQAQAVGPIEDDSGITVVVEDEPKTSTVIAHNGEDGQITRGRGALSFRIGDFFSGKDTEQMRLTAEGNLGIGLTHPKVKLDVDGLTGGRLGIVFPDGTFQYSAASKTLGARSGRLDQVADTIHDFQVESPAATTQNFIA